MSTLHHTAIANGAAANAITFNNPMGQLDAAIQSSSDATDSAFAAEALARGSADAALQNDIDDEVAARIAADGAFGSLSGVPASLTDAIQRYAYGNTTSISNRLLNAWTEAGAYETLTLTYDATYTNTVSTATVKWPDGNTGVFTATTINTTWESIDAYSVTWVMGATTKTVTQAAVTRNAEGGITAKPSLVVS